MWERTDDPVADAESWDRYQQQQLARLPKCAYCGETIQDDKCYLINDELICPECLVREHEKNTEDYMES
jgi:hypothetical protein